MGDGHGERGLAVEAVVSSLSLHQLQWFKVHIMAHRPHLTLL